MSTILLLVLLVLLFGGGGFYAHRGGRLGGPGIGIGSIVMLLLVVFLIQRI